MAERDELIQALYQSFTGSDTIKKDDDKVSVYNGSTGTLYCAVDDEQLSKMQIEQAQIYLEQQYKTYKANPLTVEKAAYYRIALEAIKMMIAEN